MEKKKNYKLIIFDFDGTLVDSINPIARGIIQAAKSIGAPPCSFEEAKGMIGLSLDEIFKKTAPGFPASMSQDYYKFYTDYFFKVDPAIGYFPGSKEMLEKLKGRGYKLAIATGKARRGLARFHERLELDKFFDDSICVDESASKPDPLMIEILLKRQDVLPEEAILVGDSEHDALTAINAGIDFMAVTFGARTEGEMKVFNPVFVAHSFDEILDFFPSSAQEEEKSPAISEG